MHSASSPTQIEATAAASLEERGRQRRENGTWRPRRVWDVRSMHKKELADVLAWIDNVQCLGFCLLHSFRANMRNDDDGSIEWFSLQDRFAAWH